MTEMMLSGESVSVFGGPPIRAGCSPRSNEWLKQVNKICKNFCTTVKNISRLISFVSLWPHIEINRGEKICIDLETCDQ